MTTAEALARFDALPGLDPQDLVGAWRGQTLSTGHPLDGLLEALGWHGKLVESPDRVHPLLFRLRSGRVVPMEPALMPTPVALRWPRLARSAPTRAAFAVLGPLLRARGPAAKLALREVRGHRSAALVYDSQPITDYLRLADEDRVVGLMERKGMAAPFFFLLTREEGEVP
ncbi:MAG TPA: GXWXG domain-containing protein [Rubellimicrobium sp.]|nr:GXWXG domain-containing protein [Rubellimicrobium sp.]